MFVSLFGDFRIISIERNSYQYTCTLRLMLKIIEMQNFIVFFFWFVTCLAVPGRMTPSSDHTYSLYNTSAFCISKPHNENFPFQPVSDLLPWVWDANYNKNQSIVELTAIFRRTCYFNFSMWTELAERFPEYGSQLGYGLRENVFVDSELDKSKVPVFGLLNNRVNCLFYKNDKLIKKVKSLRIRAPTNHYTSACLLIKCPTLQLNKNEWDFIQIEREMKTSKRVKGPTSSSQLFPTCEINEKKIYNMSVCLATRSSDREHFVEWIEYHRMIGIDHFFLYNTAIPKSKQNLLLNVLGDYIKEGIVTVVPWAFENCVKGMASGRYVGFADGKRAKPKYFRPPPAIAQLTALGSCYTRFKHLTKYMVHMDEDEFFLVKNHNLFNFTEEVFKGNPNSPAISINPLYLSNCSKDVKPSYTNKNLPRFGNWQRVYLGEQFEGKLIMRTEAVDMFYVHYITQLSNKKWDEVVYPKLSEAVLLHYKSRETSIFGKHLPINKKEDMEMVCNYFYYIVDPFSQLQVRQKLSDVTFGMGTRREVFSMSKSLRLPLLPEHVSLAVSTDFLDLFINRFQKRLFL